MRRIIPKTLLFGVGFICLSSLSAMAETTITFDELGSQTDEFSATDPLTTQYSGLGVTFSGPTAKGGGAILDEDSNFGLDALSGRDFLAFNSFATMANGGTPSGPETITFATPVSSVSIYGGDGDQVDFTMDAYGATDNLLTSDTGENAGGSYVELSVSAPGITSVTIDGDADSYVFDNLSFGSNSVPDNGSTLVGLGIGFIGLVGLRRGMITRQCQ